MELKSSFKDIIESPNFKKFLGLYFGKGTEYSYIETRMDSYEDGPDHRLILIHVPHLPDPEAHKILVEFEELIRNMKTFPENCIIDISFLSREEYIVNCATPQGDINENRPTT